MASLILFALMFVAIYFLMLRPQQQQKRAQAALHSSLQEGDLVLTSSGIYGAIAEVEGDVVWLEVAPEIELKVLKSVIVDRAPDDTADGDDDTDDADDAGDTDDTKMAEQGDEG